MAQQSQSIDASDIDNAIAVLEQLKDRMASYATPERGILMHDPDGPSWGTGKVLVSKVTNTPAIAYEINSDKPWHNTVADANPSEPSDAPVVLAQYFRKDGTLTSPYAFPVTRLERP